MSIHRFKHSAFPGVAMALWIGVAACLAWAYAADASENTVPIPPAEQGLATHRAERVVRVPDVPLDLEGPVFDARGRLIFSDAQGGRILTWTPERGIATLVRFDTLKPGGLAIHDGRLYAAAFISDDVGTIVSLDLDGDDRRTVIPRTAGHLPNDLVFDDRGGFYFTDSHGTTGDPRGGVYYVQPDSREVTPVLEHLNIANGLALAPDGQRLWVGEFASNRLHRLDLADATHIAPFGALVPYYFTGAAPDSMRVDAQGHLYVALYGQGRVLVFSRAGLPIGQILLPGRERGRFLHVTSLALEPGTKSLYIVATDGARAPGEAALFKADAFGESLH